MIEQEIGIAQLLHRYPPQHTEGMTLHVVTSGGKLVASACINPGQHTHRSPDDVLVRINLFRNLLQEPSLENPFAHSGLVR